jgi:hypothetical protein
MAASNIIVESHLALELVITQYRLHVKNKHSSIITNSKARWLSTMILDAAILLTLFFFVTRVIPYACALLLKGYLSIPFDMIVLKVIQVLVYFHVSTNT